MRLSRPVLPEVEGQILGALNEAQRAVATDPSSAVAVVAGPGSGKTRTVVHRIAHLVRVQRVAPDRILVLAYNRNAVRELRVRLHHLVGRLAAGLQVHTFHGLALSLLGRSFQDTDAALDNTTGAEEGQASRFSRILEEACELLEGSDDLAGMPDDGAARRLRLLGNLEYIFVDEYQDVDSQQYRMIRLLSGLGQDEELAEDEDDTTVGGAEDQGSSDEEPAPGPAPQQAPRRVQIKLCVVGDDDQNIYAFRGTSHEYLLRYEEEYGARRHVLVENYRSTEPIIRAANALISHNPDRCKRRPDEQVVIDRHRRDVGGRPVRALRFQSEAALADWAARQVGEWRREGVPLRQIAILAPRWDALGPTRLLLDRAGVPTQALNRGAGGLVRSLATQELLDALCRRLQCQVPPEQRVEDRIDGFFRRSGWPDDAPTVRALLRVGRDLDEERGTDEEGMPLPVSFQDIHDAIYEFDTVADAHLDEGAVVVSSCHGVKGLEFGRVLLLTDFFEPRRADSTNLQAWAERRRLFYLAMTRARDELVLCSRRGCRYVDETAVSECREAGTSAGLPSILYYFDLELRHIHLQAREAQTQQKLIRRMYEGNDLQLRPTQSQDGWAICTPKGTCVGRLSKAMNERLAKARIWPKSWTFQPGEVSVGRIWRWQKPHPITGEIELDLYHVLPQIRVCR